MATVDVKGLKLLEMTLMDSRHRYAGVHCIYNCDFIS